MQGKWEEAKLRAAQERCLVVACPGLENLGGERVEWRRYPQYLLITLLMTSRCVPEIGH